MVNKLLEGPEAREAILAKMREIGNKPYDWAEPVLRAAGFRIRPTVYGVYRKRLWPTEPLTGPGERRPTRTLEGNLLPSLQLPVVPVAGPKPRGRPRKDGTPPGSPRPGMQTAKVTVAPRPAEPDRNGDILPMPSMTTKVPVSQFLDKLEKRAQSLVTLPPEEHAQVHQNQMPQAMQVRKPTIADVEDQLVAAGWTPPEPEPPQETKDALALIQRFRDLVEECGGIKQFREMAEFILGDAA